MAPPPSPALCRHLADGLASLPNPIGTPVDKLRVGLYRLKALLGSTDGILREPETTILEALRVSRQQCSRNQWNHWRDEGPALTAVGGTQRQGALEKW